MKMGHLLFPLDQVAGIEGERKRSAGDGSVGVGTFRNPVDGLFRQDVPNLLAFRECGEGIPHPVVRSPNFDSSQWCRCSPGQWVASVWDGQKRIDIACGDSLEDAKRAGYLKAHWGILPQPGEMELDRISKAVWEDGPAEPNIE